MATEFMHQLQISGPRGSETFTLPEGITTIGRQVDLNVVLDDPERKVSRKHAQIERQGNRCTLTDLKSSNGTILNDTPLAPHTPMPLNEGDSIKISSFVLNYALIESFVPPPAPPPVEEEVIQPEEVTFEEALERPSPPPPEISDALTEKPAEQPSEPATPPPVEPPPEPPASDNGANGTAPYTPPPGMQTDYSRYMAYLPEIYDSDFMHRFLALLESIYGPIEMTVDNFDLFLDSGTAPGDFLPWLANWFDFAFDHTWTDAQKRLFLKDAHLIYARRGTKWSLERMLEIYTGVTPIIDDAAESHDPHHFTINIPLPTRELNLSTLERLIDLCKPAHTVFKLRTKG